MTNKTMGYTTRYKIHAKNISSEDEAKMDDMIFSDNLYDRIFLSALINLGGHVEKWYEHEDYMIRLSCDYPNVTFEVIGIGSDKFDVWVKVFKNGKILNRYAFNEKISFSSH